MTAEPNETDIGESNARLELITFGQSTADQQQLIELLQGADVRSVVGVWIESGSRRNPDLLRSNLAHWMPQVGIHYRWERDLGGFRKPPVPSRRGARRAASGRGRPGDHASGCSSSRRPLRISHGRWRSPGPGPPVRR
ncbi:DUF488 domain-containing protein [Streptomyces sp. Je 1-4]|uniref:DUF488 domain-containing protein n=1 Tax=Streptomyces TaxID=1883 RepID=UPI0021D926F1|nr:MULTISPECIES: DUF488 domain-containing protein [unclassified Streptomyces]UYB37785.1 DUF488 domain-containing protein [Streptomyces sp. Je 1-4]UZQ33696.1 DUF488 domain-containing protein [Streptomyces sp. Je 1-4] [Streptomyces sp. Je 1-4 4N24]UZQ41114.1 DUF488 domain-containing protein [Streptomyces sp. Je 1-4] [Streptomyces sp. Je 1-4 4N24_ara]